jgi:2-oxoisovalerate dehydrogenase E1 component
MKFLYLNEVSNKNKNLGCALGVRRLASRRGTGMKQVSDTQEVRTINILSAEAAYKQMAMIRRFEERCLELSQDGLVAGSIHLCLGQEAIPVGALSALEPQDRVLATYRGHGWALASGSSPTALMGEIAQRAGGLNGGRAGSPLLSDPDHGFMGENSIVGAGNPIATGVALASIARGDNRVVLSSFGDGAMNQGSTTEAMIFAAAMNLPVIFICENNGWSEMTPTSLVLRGEDFVQRAQGIGIESHVVDGGDPLAVARAVLDAATKCRRGEGPVFLECKTVRLSGHYNRDIQHYRPQADIDSALLGDPLLRLSQYLIDHGHFTKEELDQIDATVAADIDVITASVLAMPSPDPASVRDHVIAPDLYSQIDEWGPRQEAKSLTYQRAINLALKEELLARPELMIYGEDVGFAGGIFGVTRGLQKEFGASRVFDTPISESAILGSAVGMAIEGMRPVVEIMWADFVFVALDQIINQASNVRYVNRSRLTAPITIRMQQGVSDGSCAQHSQSVEGIFAHIPGIKVGLPATAQDAYSMTRAAIGDPDPTILIESRVLYQDSAPVVTGGDSEIAAGARRHRTGQDVSIITWGVMLKKALEAADILKEQGIEATVLDLRWLRPLDEDAIAAAVRESQGRVIVVHEDFVSGAFGAEIASRITEGHFTELVRPVKRIGSAEVRMPSAPSLQGAVVPSAQTIVDAVLESMNPR